MKEKLVQSMILRTLKEKKSMTFGLLFTIIIVVILNLLPPQILQRMIDEHLLTGNTDGMAVLAAAYLLILIGIGVFEFLKGWILTVFGQRIIKYLRLEMMRKTQRIGISYFTANSSGSIASRFNVDVENVNEIFTDGVVSMMIDCLKIIGIVISIFIFSVPLGMMSLLLVPVIYGISRFFKSRMLTAQIKNLEQLSQVNAHIAETLESIGMIKIFQKENYMGERYAGRLNRNYQTKERVNLYDSCYAPVIQMVRAFVIALLVVLSSDKMGFLGISVGMTAASIDLISNLLLPVESLGMEIQNIQKGISGIRRINEFYQKEEEPPKRRELTVEEILGEQGAQICFTDMSFGYEPNRPVLEQINLNVRPGENVTLTGRTGVGKTTLFNLIMGLLEPVEGTVKLNDTPVAQIPNSIKRRLFGYVEQKFEFIEGTVAEQISLKDPDITREQIEDACRFTGLHTYILGLEQGYDTVLNKGEEFSQGQKQLLSIARAIVSDPAVLLLDEITANLDSTTEERVVTVLKNAMKGRTILSISHRVTSMLNCDRVIHIEEGRIRA